MGRRFGHQAVLTILLICQFSVCLATERPSPPDPNRYLNAVRESADNVLLYGRDTHGPKHTLLFVDIGWVGPDSLKKDAAKASAVGA